MQRFIYLLIVTNGLLTKAWSQNVNRPVPPVLYPYEFVHYSDAEGYYLTVPFKLGASAGENNRVVTPVLLDANGYVCWYGATTTDERSSDFKFIPEIQRFVFEREESNGASAYQLLNEDFQWQTELTNANGVEPDPHEFVRLENGNYILVGRSYAQMDLSAYNFNGTQGSSTTTVFGFVVQELDPSGNLIWEWDSNNYIHPSEWVSTYPYNANAFDYCHGNAVEEDIDGNLLISFRHLDAVYKIHRISGSIIWRLGGLSSDFTFPNDIGFSGQHDIRVHPGGIVSLYDNANSSPFPKKSRGVEYLLDTVNWTATKMWEYVYDPAFFARAMGNHQVREDGLHLINYGLNFRPHPSFVLTDSDGALVSELFFSDSVMSYRSYFVDLPFEPFRPTVLCDSDESGVQLSVSGSYPDYLWSTGEEQSVITVNVPGTYQVWVNHGEGMAGSEPIVITEALECQVGVDELVLQDTGDDGLFDLLGRPVVHPKYNVLYIKRSTTGVAQKIIYTGH